MAVVNLSGGSTQNELLEKLLLQYGKQSQPKVGGLQRILAPLTGIGSGIDAYHDMRYEDRNPGFLSFLKNYGQNILQGFGTLATGKSYENIEGMSELLDRSNPAWKNTGIGRSPWGRMGVDVAAGIITDPTTYASFGATSLGDDVLRTALTKGGGLSDDIAKKVLPKISGGTLDDVVKTLTKELGPDIADKVYVNVLQNVGRSTAKSGALKVLGKTISETPAVVKGSKALISPLGGVMDAAGWASKKFTPGLRASALDVFDPVQGAIEAGKGDIAADLLKFNRESAGLYRGVLSELRDAGLIKTFNKLDPEEKADMAKLIEATKETAYDAARAGDLIKNKPAVLEALREYAGAEIDELSEIYPKSQFKMDTILDPDKLAQPSGQLDLDYALLETAKDVDRKNMLATQKLDELYSSLDEDVKPLLDPLIERVNKLGADEVTYKELSKIFDDTIGNYADEGGQLLSVPEGISDDAKTFLSKYFDFERDRIKEMERLGLPVLSPKEMGYISRDPIGYRKRILENTLKNEGLEDVYGKLMSNKKVIKDLNELGYVKKETLQKVLDRSEYSAFKSFDPGMLGELMYGKGAAKERAFKTLEEAEAAGLVYGSNPLKNIYDQTVRQNEQILAADFAQRLVKGDAFAPTSTGLKQTPITVPGVGTFYTDKHTAKIAEDYVSRYTTQEGMDKLLSGFDKIQSMWKKFVTGMGPNAPAYHARNLIDDNIRLVLDGADIKTLPKDYQLAMDVFKYEDLINKVGKEEALKQMDQSRAANFLKRVGVEAENPLDEVWKRAVDNGVYSDFGKSMVEMGIEEPREVAEAIGGETSENLGERMLQKGEDAMTLKGRLPRREQATRMATYFNYWGKEGAESAGVDAVQRISFNYNELTKAEREVMKRIIPFYGFVKNNLKFYLGMLKDNPEKLARFNNVYEGLQTGSQSLYGEEWEAMPDYVKETLSIPFGKTEEGELKYLSGLNLGIENLGDIPMGPLDRKGLQNAAGNLSPGLNTLIELISGRDLFRDEDIMSVNQGYNYENRSDFIKKLMNYQKYPVDIGGGRTFEKQTVSPAGRYFLEQVPFVSTANTTLRRFADLRDKEQTLENLTNMLLPAKIDKRNIEGALERKERGKYDELYKLLQRKGIADVYQSFYIPKGLREELLK